MDNINGVKNFTTNNSEENVLRRLAIYEEVKDGQGVSLDAIAEKIRFGPDQLREELKYLEDRKAVEMSAGEKTSSPTVFCREGDGKGFLGVNFENEQVRFTVLDYKGEFSREEILRLDGLKTLRGRVGEIRAIVKGMSTATSFRGIPFRSGGVVIEGLLEGKAGKGVSIITEGLSRMFKCRFFVANRALASAYAEREQHPYRDEKELIYLFTDSGEGIVFKGEEIYVGMPNASGKESYLRAWRQFDAAATAKRLVEKGLGTDIVDMVGGDLENVSIATVLKAAEGNDELALDLVKRSALALGVRAAYISNIYGIDTTVIGGGIEAEEGNFSGYMKESYSRFLTEERKQKAEIKRGRPGGYPLSLGAALLCRRESFMEG